MNINDVNVYFYLVKEIDYIKVTEQYEALYNDVINHLPQLPEESQQFLCKYIKDNLAGCENKWTKLLLEFVNQKRGS